MTTPAKKLKVYPSSSGFISDLGLEAEYNSACLRYMVISIGANRKDIDPIYAELGLLHEDWYAERLGDELKEREFPIKFDLAPTVEYSGRVDFLTHDGRVHETKASMSKNFLYKHIRKGEVKLSHLAQVVSYMIHLQLPKAVIAAGFYDEQKTLKEKRFFDVSIRDDGMIVVDDIPTGLEVKHQLAHLNAAVHALSTLEIGQRPENYLEFGSACHFCPVKALCSSYDFGHISAEELREQGREAINNEPVKMRKVPEPKKYVKKR